jgi:Tol biopolymer transport system component
MPMWSPDGKWITYTHCAPSAQTAWVHQADQPDTDHFNRAYRPDLARGGTGICLISPESGKVITVTHDERPHGTSARTGRMTHRGWCSRVPMPASRRGCG